MSLDAELQARRTDTIYAFPDTNRNDATVCGGIGTECNSTKAVFLQFLRQNDPMAILKEEGSEIQKKTKREAPSFKYHTNKTTCTGIRSD